MRITKRLPELWPSGILTLLACLSSIGSATSGCSSDDGDNAKSGDAGGEAEAPRDANVAEIRDAGTNDVALIDAAPLAIRCEAPPCAVALTTTIESDTPIGNEGYCALLSDGTVACWGANTAGQLGTGATSGVDSAVGVRVPGLSGVVAIDHTCAVDRDGAVWCWGKGPFVENETTAVTVVGSPVHITLPGPAQKVAVGREAACALLQDERVYCWGGNMWHLLGPDALAPFNTPTRIELPSGIKSIALGNTAYVLYEDGKLLSWGPSTGVGRVTSLDIDMWPTPIAVEHVTMIDTIESESCMVANGVGWCWGAAYPPVWGVPPDPLQRALPAGVDTPEPITRIATSKSRTVTDNSDSSFEKHRWCATSVTGALYCWGLNNSGQAGDGTKEFATASVRVGGLPAPAAEVKIMPYSTCTLLTNGKVFCWGNNAYGQIGAGLPKGSVLTPTEVKLP